MKYIEFTDGDGGDSYLLSISSQRLRKAIEELTEPERERVAVMLGARLNYQWKEGFLDWMRRKDSDGAEPSNH